MGVERYEFGSAGKYTDESEVAQVHMAAIDAEIDGEHPMVILLSGTCKPTISTQAAHPVCQFHSCKGKRGDLIRAACPVAGSSNTEQLREGFSKAFGAALAFVNALSELPEADNLKPEVLQGVLELLQGKPNAPPKSTYVADTVSQRSSSKVC